MLKIRRANVEDGALLAAAEREIAKKPGRLASSPDELKDEVFKRTISFLKGCENGIYIVAESNTKIVAHAFIMPLNLKSTSHVVNLTIAVHEGYQSQGVGTELMNYLISWSKKNNKIEKMELHVRSSNKIAINLYKSLGFIEEGRKTKRLKLESGTYLDDIYMALWVG